MRTQPDTTLSEDTAPLAHQSRRLVGIVGLCQLAGCLRATGTLWATPLLGIAAGVSLGFAALVLGLRAATPAAALWGAMVCFNVIAASRTGLLHSGLTPLAALFILTFAATCAGRSRRRPRTDEERHGRNAGQVLANLGTAGAVATLGLFGPAVTAAIVISALAEATADTVSSEIGQRFGGRPWLGLRQVEPGTDGAVSALGTAAGAAGAGLVVLAGAWACRLNARGVWTAFACALAGLLFDSLLGATAERRGWLNNDLVNFSSTVFSALLTALLLSL